MMLVINDDDDAVGVANEHWRVSQAKWTNSNIEHVATASTTRRDRRHLWTTWRRCRRHL